ncbi:hypothetical protein HDU92_009109, partial [Lobulomyces angularis]
MEILSKINFFDDKFSNETFFFVNVIESINLKIEHEVQEISNQRLNSKKFCKISPLKSLLFIIADSIKDLITEIFSAQDPQIQEVSTRDQLLYKDMFDCTAAILILNFCLPKFKPVQKNLNLKKSSFLFLLEDIRTKLDKIVQEKIYPDELRSKCTRL